MKSTTRGAHSFPRSPCPIANLLELVGDKWTLLVIRDMLRGRKTYGELLDSPERIPTNILADRLKRLMDAGLISRSAYQERPTRYAYALTEKGASLGEVLIALAQWGKAHIPATLTVDEVAAGAGRGKGSGRPAATRRRSTRAG